MDRYIKNGITFLVNRYNLNAPGPQHYVVDGPNGTKLSFQNLNDAEQYLLSHRNNSIYKNLPEIEVVSTSKPVTASNANGREVVLTDLNIQHLINQRHADLQAHAMTPELEHILGLNMMSPVLYVRSLYNTATTDQSFADALSNQYMYGNNGLVSDEWAHNHPYAAMAVNMAGDILAPTAFTKGLTLSKGLMNGARNIARNIPKYSVRLEVPVLNRNLLRPQPLYAYAGIPLESSSTPWGITIRRVKPVPTGKKANIKFMEASEPTVAPTPTPTPTPAPASASASASAPTAPTVVRQVSQKTTKNGKFGINKKGYIQETVEEMSDGTHRVTRKTLDNDGKIISTDVETILPITSSADTSKNPWWRFLWETKNANYGPNWKTRNAFLHVPANFVIGPSLVGAIPNAISGIIGGTSYIANKSDEITLFLNPNVKQDTTTNQQNTTTNQQNITNQGDTNKIIYDTPVDVKTNTKSANELADMDTK